ncbi:MAG: methionyl-tRNA formyltransferase [Candidatus Shapirobacteria bacterium]
MDEDILRSFFSDKNIYLSMTKDGFICLKDLIAHGKEIDTILTLPFSKAANVSDYQDFSSMAKKSHISLYYIEKINVLLPILQKYRPHIIIVNGWSQLLSLPLIKTAKHGCVGLHPALLPKNRGRAPIAWHFINQEKYGGVTLFYLDAGCDSGPIIDQEKFKILDSDNASSFYKKMTLLASKLLLNNFDDIVNNRAKATKQNNSQATYLLVRRPKHSRINFNYPALSIQNLIRAVTDIYPLANFSYNSQTYYVKDSEILKNAPQFSGFPGQIAKVTNKGLWILTGSRIICLKKIINSQNKLVQVIKQFKTGDILNE